MHGAFGKDVNKIACQSISNRLKPSRFCGKRVIRILIPHNNTDRKVNRIRPDIADQSSVKTRIFAGGAVRFASPPSGSAVGASRLNASIPEDTPQLRNLLMRTPNKAAAFDFT